MIRPMSEHKSTTTLHDPIYGRIEIDSPVLIDILQSTPIQRLKRISQFGLPDEYYHIDGYSRYDHSVGVMALLIRMGAKESEVLAGLLHDVSHMAFSHIADWVIGGVGREDVQDSNHESFISSSELPAILRKYGYETDDVVEYERYGLLEQDAPDLCADRVDYTLRELPVNVARTCFAGLRVHDEEIVFTDLASASLFANSYLGLQTEHWGGFEAVSRYSLMSSLLRSAIESRVLSVDDLWQDDMFVIAKLLDSGRTDYIETLKTLRMKSLSVLRCETRPVVKKFRYVDPKFIAGDRLVRLSEADEHYRRELEYARKACAQGVCPAEIRA